MKKSKSEQWIDALAWDNKTLGVPTIVSQTITKEAGKALRKAKVYRPPIRIPKAAQRVPMTKLKKELDRVFSIFIRTRDSVDGIGTCVTCGVRRHWKQMQASHYCVRQDLATRWDETNVHLACGNCNGFRSGEPEKMAAYINKKYGEGTAERIKLKAKTAFRPSRQFYESNITAFKFIIGEK